MTALAHETTETATPPSDLDEALWLAWQAAVEKLPEGFRAEIIEGSIEVSPTGRYSHGETVNELRDTLVVFLAAGGYAARQDMNVIHGRKVWIPDLFIAPKGTQEHVTEDGIGIKASAVELVVEVVSPGRDCISRDRVRKRRAYAHAGIPVYILIDDFDDGGTVTVLTSPDPEKAVYEDEVRAAYGTSVTIPAGPAKGFAIGEDITGPGRGGG
ncbi:MULTISPECIES: Uma2 family endonuclease [unclassified Streptomyces]|uniref:Uma2 family endonuclease n=1 Tax=unclassified Streptomyces TaxID=2593676 RepID=UPI000DC7C009|nr:MULTISPECIES: Uma2 family endonuclease [unclassified Streptomyces]AWZ08226.1 Uma2 family endonuclease [Streptomyces sp. ICC4]AWZ15330.1 Uma2 family endonuclease [Streptomyces sp. ICC1]